MKLNKFNNLLSKIGNFISNTDNTLYWFVVIFLFVYLIITKDTKGFMKNITNLTVGAWIMYIFINPIIKYK